MHKILKRDGRSAEFDQSKIYSAIFKASEASGENLEPIDIEFLTHNVVKRLNDPCTVEQVQDIVEQMLIKYDYEKTAKAYILYRSQRTKLREANSELMEIFDELTNKEAIDSDIKRENANVDGNTAMGTMLKYGSESAKYYIDKYILPEKIAKAHANGDIHIHDKDFYLLTETCVTANDILIVCKDGKGEAIFADELEEMFDLKKDEPVETKDFFVLSEGRFVEVKNVVSHAPGQVLKITTDTGSLEVTSEHRVSVIRNGKRQDIKACELRINDELVYAPFTRNRFGNELVSCLDAYADDSSCYIAGSHKLIWEAVKQGKRVELESALERRLKSTYDLISVADYLKIRHLVSPAEAIVNKYGEFIPADAMFILDEEAGAECADSHYIPRWAYTACDAFLKGFICALIEEHGCIEDYDEYSILRLSDLDFVDELQPYLLFRGIPSFRDGDELDIPWNETISWVFEDIDELLTEVELEAASAITGIEIVEYEGMVYDMETEGHHFDVNGFNVHNCCQIDPLKLYENGFSTGHGFLREPQSIGSYASLACIAIQANQNEMHGGQSIPNYDYAMAPGVLKTFKKEFKSILSYGIEDLYGITEAAAIAEEFTDKIEGIAFDPVEAGFAEELAVKLGNNVSLEVIKDMFSKTYERAFEKTNKATYQAMEGMIHNLNTMNSRAGAQVPFSSINFGTDTSSEGRMVIKNFLLATNAGLGNGETPIFPVSIFKVKEGINFNEDDPNYDLFKLAIRVSAKRLFPNFSFLDSPFNKAFYKEGDYNSEVAYMGCRTRVMANSYDPSKAVVCGRGNLSFTSVNLPRLGIESHGDFELFYKKLDAVLELVSEQLLHRFKIQSAKKVKNYPFLMGQGIWIDSDTLGPDDTVGEVLKHGTLSIGFIGLAETMKAMTGRHHGEDETARKQAYEIVKHIREFCDKKSEETGLNFTCLATPAEGLSGRFVKIDKKKYGVIPGVTDREYYTNSFHVPVYYPISAFEKIEIEAPYHELTNAGHISYVEVDGDIAKNPEAFESIIRYMKEKGVGYGSVNHPVDRDPVCGYVGIIDNVCPRCGRREGEKISIERLNELRKKFPNVPVPCDCTH